MDTPVIVALIGGAVTLLGFIISGAFGLIASSSQRQGKITEQRIAFKDEQLVDCERDLADARLKLEACGQRHAHATEELRQAQLDLWEAKGRLHAAEVALLNAKTDTGIEHHHQTAPPPPEEDGDV